MKETIHELKTDPDVFDAVFNRIKTYEIRMDDRGYQCGHYLRLRETRHTGVEMAAGKPLVYTGRVCVQKVNHILYGPIYGLEKGWVIMNFDPNTSLRLGSKK